MNRHFYKIAGFTCCISFEEGQENGVSLIPSFEPFRIDEAEAASSPTLFSLHVDDSLRPIPKDQRERIRKVDTGNGDTIVDETKDGYQFIIKDLFGNGCCLLQTTADFSDCRCALNGSRGMRIFGLNNALMLAFAFSGSERDTALIHASTVRKDGYGYAFTAKSGTGKSTHVAQWLGNIPGCDMMNDDNPIVRIEDGVPYIYGSPWSGKTPCYRNVRARLGAIVKINRDDTNHVSPAKPIEAFTTLLGACSSMKWDRRIFDNVCRIITTLVESAPNYNLYCRPDKEAAIVCHNAISRNRKLQ